MCSWLCDVSKMEALAVQLRMPESFGIIIFLDHKHRTRTLFLVKNVDSSRKCSGTGGRCSFHHKKSDPKDFAPRSNTSHIF